MNEHEAVEGRVMQATKLAVLIRAYQAGAFQARNDEERTILDRLDELLDPEQKRETLQKPNDLEPLNDRDYLRVRDALQERLDVLYDAWRRGMGVPDSPDRRERLSDVARVFAPPPDA